MSIRNIGRLEKQDLSNLLHHPVALALMTALASLGYGMALASSVSPVLLIAAPLALVVAMFALFKAEIAAIVLLGITWGYISETANKFHGIPSLSKPLVALLVVNLVLKRFTGRRVPWVYDTSIWWMTSYFLVICLGMWYATVPDRTLLLVIDFAKDLILFLVLINLISSLSLFEDGVWVLLAVGALLGTLTLVQEVTQNYDATFGGLARAKVDSQIAEGFSNRPRAGGPTSEPLAFSQQLLVLVPLGLWGMVYGSTRARRLFAGYTFVACLGGIGLSFSRSSYVALAVVLALFALHIRLNWRYLLLIVPLLGVLLWVAPPELTARFSTLEQLLPGEDGVSPESTGLNSEASYRMRYVQLQMAINMFMDHPLLGVGGWNFVVLYPEYIQQSGSSSSVTFGPPHNYLLEIAADHGVLGLFVIVGILVVTWRRLHKARRSFMSTGNQRMAELAAALQIAFVGYLTSAAFLHGLYSRFLWLQVSLAVALALIAQREQAKTSVMEISKSTLDAHNEKYRPHTMPA